VASVAETLDTVGKAVAFSALTVLASLAAILLVPSPAFRSMALGIVLSMIAVLAATLTLLPAVLGRLGTRINAGAIRLPRHRGQGSCCWLPRRSSGLRTKAVDHDRSGS
jgi:RND superfamily putative drug exporter